MSNIKSLHTWFKISNPNKPIFFWQFITALIPAGLKIFIAIPSANLINSLSVYDYIGAKTSLIHIIILIVLCFIFWNINYLIYPLQIKHMYKTTHKKIFDKVINISDEGLKLNSKEKMIHILSNNMHHTIEFTNILTIKFAYLFTSIVMISIVIFYSLPIGLITLGISTFSYLFYFLINIKLGKRLTALQSAKDDLVENFSYVIDGKNISNDLNLTKELEEKYNNSVKNIANNYKKQHILNLFSEKWVYYFWKLLINITTFYLISLVERNILTLTIYLFITPYLTSTIENFFTFLSMFNSLSLARISALRVKTILDMNQEDFVNFGNNSTNNIDGAITFTNVSYTDNNEPYNTIKTFSLQIPKNSIFIIKGDKKSGKKTLFNILKRKIRPSTGTITLDTINIYDFDKKTYSNNFSYTTSTPYFFNDSILNNLKFITKNQKFIKDVLNKLKLENIIDELPNKINTNILKEKGVISNYLQFMLGLARAILTNCEIICIYEFPSDLNNNEVTNIKRVILQYSKFKTFIIFTKFNFFDDISTGSISITNGNMNKEL